MGLCSLIKRLFDSLKSYFSGSRLKEEFPSCDCLLSVMKLSQFCTISICFLVKQEIAMLQRQEN